MSRRCSSGVTREVTVSVRGLFVNIQSSVSELVHRGYWKPAETPTSKSALRGIKVVASDDFVVYFRELLAVAMNLKGCGSNRGRLAIRLAGAVVEGVMVV